MLTRQTVKHRPSVSRRRMKTRPLYSISIYFALLSKTNNVEINVINNCGSVVVYELRAQHIIVLSHWPHVATHVATQVAQLVASVKGLGHKLPHLLLNVSECRKLRASAASSIFRRHVESHGYSLPIRKWNS